MSDSKPLDILLVEDNPADARLTQEALDLTGARVTLHTVADGEAAMDYLRREGAYAEAGRPDIVLLDLNLPRRDGREVLAAVKDDPTLRSIPVVVLTTSRSTTDIQRMYDLHANCYVTKPIDLEDFIDTIRCIREFWGEVARLPPRAEA